MKCYQRDKELSLGFNSAHNTANDASDTLVIGMFRALVSYHNTMYIPIPLTPGVSDRLRDNQINHLIVCCIVFPRSEKKDFVQLDAV